MNSSDTNLWEKVLGEIQTEISQATFLTLFKGTTLLSFDSGVVTVSAPSSMIIDLLQKRFYDTIKRTVDKHTGKDSKIIFVPKVISPIVPSSHGPLFSYEKDTKTSVGHLPRVRADFNFQNFAVSGTNQLAFVSAMAVAKKVGRSYNPLFIYGPVGVGKTHLMQAVANEVYEKNPSKKILYITSEEFTNEVVEAIRSNDTGRMKKRFRNLDLLIIDDVQFIGGKDRVQEELFHTFNILVDRSSQIVLSADRSPSEIKRVEKRLISRFGGGLTVDIEIPDFELRSAILLIKAKKHGFDIPIELAKTIAGTENDARSLEGILIRIINESKSSNATFEEIAGKIMKIKTIESHHIHPDDIIKNTCLFYGIKPTLLKSPNRSARLVKARQVAMFLLKKELSLTFSEIGNLLGGRDHTTVMHGVEKVEKLPAQDLIYGDIMRITKLSQLRSLSN